MQRFRKAVAIVGAGLALSITAAWCAAFASQAHPDAILRHLNWLMLYLPGFMLPAIAVGIPTLGISMARGSTIDRRMDSYSACWQYRWRVSSLTPW